MLQLPQLWKLSQVISLQNAASRQPREPAMTHQGTLSRQGAPASFNLPDPGTYIPVSKPCFPTTAKADPPAPDHLKPSSGTNRSVPDPTQCPQKLSMTGQALQPSVHQDAVCQGNGACQEADLLMSEAVFSSLAGTFAPTYEQGWEIPVTIRQKHPASQDSATASQAHTQVVMSDPLVKRVMTLREKHDMLYFHAVRMIACQAGAASSQQQVRAVSNKHAAVASHSTHKRMDTGQDGTADMPMRAVEASGQPSQRNVPSGQGMPASSLMMQGPYSPTHTQLHSCAHDQPSSPIQNQPCSPTQIQPCTELDNQPYLPTQNQSRTELQNQPYSPTHNQPYSPTQRQPYSPTQRPYSPKQRQPYSPTQHQPYSPTHQPYSPTQNHPYVSTGGDLQQQISSCPYSPTQAHVQHLTAPRPYSPTQHTAAVPCSPTQNQQSHAQVGKHNQTDSLPPDASLQLPGYTSTAEPLDIIQQQQRNAAVPSDQRQEQASAILLQGIERSHEAGGVHSLGGVSYDRWQLGSHCLVIHSQLPSMMRVAEQVFCCSICTQSALLPSIPPTND